LNKKKQTANVVCNYVNRSGGEVDMTELTQSYLLACTAACSIAVGASKAVISSFFRTNFS